MQSASPRVIFYVVLIFTNSFLGWSAQINL